MIRVLIMIAVAGFFVSVVSLSLAVGIAGPSAIAHGAWSWGPNGWGAGWVSHRGGWRNDDAPQATREIAWTGSDALTVDLAADVRYTQAAGPAKLIVSGPQAAVNDVQVDNGHIHYGHDHDDDGELTIVMTSPSITRFGMQGGGKLAIVDYHQDRLDLDLSGSAGAVASGGARSVQLDITGSADADLHALRVRSAKVDIEGSGDATLAPRDAAEVDISGSGDVTLLTHPAQLHTDISGSGRLIQSRHNNDAEAHDRSEDKDDDR